MDQAGFGPADHVVEIGAGTGILTQLLADRCARVTAVELDPDFVGALRRRFASEPRIMIVAGDIIGVPLPASPYRAFGNIPFGITTAILRRLLDDPAGPLRRADLLVQFEAARKRASIAPSSLQSLGWLPWWDLGVIRRVPAGAFDPLPPVDAALLSARRRPVPLLPADQRPAYVATLRSAFRASSQPVARGARGGISPRAWKRLARERGIRVDARPAELDVFDWVDIFNALRGRGPGVQGVR